MNINDQRVQPKRSDEPWHPAQAGDLPARLVGRPVESWRDKQWQLSPDHWGVFPDAVSKYGSGTSTWTGRAVARDGRVYEYRLIWRGGDRVLVTFERRGRRAGQVSIPLEAYFPFDEKLHAGVTDVGHVEDHIDPASEQDVRRQESAYWDKATDDDPDWSLLDGEYRAGVQVLWGAFREVASDPSMDATEDDPDDDRASLVAPDGHGVGYDDLAILWAVSRRQAERIATGLVERGLVRTDIDPNSRGGKPKKLFWRVEDEG